MVLREVTNVTGFDGTEPLDAVVESDSFRMAVEIVALVNVDDDQPAGTVEEFVIFVGELKLESADVVPLRFGIIVEVMVMVVNVVD